MKSKLIITRNKKASAGPHAKFEPRQWLEIARVGEWPNTAPAEAQLPDGTSKSYPQGVLQVITPDSLAEILNSFDFATDSPTLIDKEHESTQGNTLAFGWVTELVLGTANVDPAGQPGEGKANEPCLWARPRYSVTGLNAVTGGDFLQLSPHFGCRFLPGQESADIPRVEPVYLTDIALTNKPAMQMTSIANAKPPTVAPSGQPNNETKPDPTMKKTAALLGLPETATDEEIAAAVQVLIDAQKSTATEVANMKSVAADAFVKAHATSIPNTDTARAAWKAMHIANSTQAEAMIGGGANQQTAVPAVVVPNAATAPAVVPVFQAAQAVVPATPGAEIQTQNTAATDVGASKLTDTELLKVYNSQPAGQPKALFYRKHKTRLSPLV